MSKEGLAAWSVLLALTTGAAAAQDFGSWEWAQVNVRPSFEPHWRARAGLQAVALNGGLYVMGGRTPLPPQFPPVPGASTLWSDVWWSEDRGDTWFKLLESDGEHWSPRAYFQAVTKGPYMYVLGGQNFKTGDECDQGQPVCSDFFADVWRSRDGMDWEPIRTAAGWQPRAGLSSVVLGDDIYVMAGSQIDDEAFGGERIFFNDVWRSRNGRDWIEVTAEAPWEPRAGAVAVAKDDYIYLLGGEDGFFCEPVPCEPPYYNDVWRSADGANWELVTEAADWPARPGHQCVVWRDTFVCFGGFGQSQDPDDPFKPSNPMDVWVSQNGADWVQVSDSPWNAEGPEDIKYDFDALVLPGRAASEPPAVFTLGGDRETFDFFDLENYLRVDSDVWRFGPSP